MRNYDADRECFGLEFQIRGEVMSLDKGLRDFFDSLGLSNLGRIDRLCLGLVVGSLIQGSFVFDIIAYNAVLILLQLRLGITDLFGGRARALCLSSCSSYEQLFQMSQQWLC